MRIVYLDIDTLRPDHLGCYGYHRATSPAIDAIAAEGVRMGNCYCADGPCLPSRSGFFTGRFGIHTGVVDHAGIAADPYPEGAGRGFHSAYGRTGFVRLLREQGLYTASISPFAERHSAWWFCAGFREMINTGEFGGEIADDVTPAALDWIGRKGSADGWFLHINLWDAHNPYRTPAAFGEPFADAPAPGWLTQDVLDRHLAGAGPECARDAAEFQAIASGVDPHPWTAFPRQPTSITDLAQAKRMFDGYDTGIRYADQAVARIIAALKRAGVYEDTAIIISTDHGENLGELNIYGAHMTADEATCHLPLIIRWPGVTDRLAGRCQHALHYQVDTAATIIDLAGGTVPATWDGRSFADALRTGRDAGRQELVLSNLAGSCQRSVRFGDWLCIRSYHDGYHDLPDHLLFDVRRDPHQLEDLAPRHPEVVAEAMRRLDAWSGDMLRSATHAQDPLWTVMQAGGAEHTRGFLPGYLRHLRATGRAAAAERLALRHPSEAGSV